MLTISISCQSSKDLSLVNSESKTSESETISQNNGYWTCTMHPEVHMEKPGSCPICGMNLIYVASNNLQNFDETQNDKTPSIQINEMQLNAVQIPQYTVKKKDLKIETPVSGNLISPNDITIQIYESDLSLITTGSQFFGTISSAPQDSLSGLITKIDTTIDPTTRTIRAYGKLKESPKFYITDSSFQGKVVSLLTNQIVIPENALFHSGTKDLVYVFSPQNKVSAKTVISGYKTANEYQIISGLNEGDVISAGPNFLIDSESKIRGSSD